MARFVLDGPPGVKTIFVVDDDAEQAELLAQALGAKGRKVRAFADPIRALAALSADGADLLVVDVSMPWIDGGDVVATARLSRPPVRIILVSGYPHGAAIAERHGVPFFAKPLDLARLRDTVAQLLAPVATAEGK